MKPSRCIVGAVRPRSATKELALRSPGWLFAADGPKPAVKALAFDGFPIFDPRAMGARAASVLPAGGKELAQAWTNKLFALSWIETSAGRYSGFERLARGALDFAARSMGIALTDGQTSELVRVFHELPLWPDAMAGLEKLRSADIRLAFLSNLTEAMLQSAMDRNGLGKLMETPISTDRVSAFKPSPLAYAMGPKAFGLPKEQIGFVAFGGWDALGASWYGYRTAWINRLGVEQEPLEPSPTITSRDFSAVLKLANVAST